MDIAALSIVKARIDTSQQIGVALASEVLDQAEVQGEELIKLMERSVQPDLGSNIDIKL